MTGRALLLALALMSLPQAGRAQTQAQLDWSPDAAEICIFGPETPAETPAQRTAAKLIGTLPPEMPLHDLLESAGIALCIDSRPSEARGAYLPEARLVVLSARLSEDTMMAILLHELRHIDQIERGYCPTLDLKMADYVRATFSMEADAQAIATLLAWQLREGGKPGPWSALIDMPETVDIAQAFAAAMEEGKGIEAATAAAFDAWFVSAERKEAYYISTCSAYLDALDENNLLPSYNALETDHLDRLCLLPDGGSYPCREGPIR